jgi:hypothetical protein
MAWTPGIDSAACITTGGRKAKSAAVTQRNTSSKSGRDTFHIRQVKPRHVAALDQ